MASTSTAKRTTKRTRAASESSDDCLDIVEIPSGKKKSLCIICGGPSSVIEKDSNFDTMMQVFWCTLGIDVKPELCNKSDACAKCFEKVVKYFETNDIIVYFENYFKRMRSELLKKALKGITVWEKEGTELHRIQALLKEKVGSYADYKEPERDTAAIKATLDAYEVKESVEETEGDDDGQGPSRKVLQLTRLNDTEKTNSKANGRANMSESESDD